jgi:hypothetical protein
VLPENAGRHTAIESPTPEGVRRAYEERARAGTSAGSADIEGTPLVPLSYAGCDAASYVAALKQAGAP